MAEVQHLHSVCVYISHDKSYLKTWQPFEHPAPVTSVEQGSQLIPGNGSKQVKMSEKLPPVPQGHCVKPSIKCQTLNWSSRGVAYYPS